MSSLFIDDFYRRGLSDKEVFELSLGEFLDVITANQSSLLPDDRKLWTPDDYPLMAGQAMYIVDYTKKEIIYHRGIKELLGYSDEEFNVDLAVSYYHPDQLPVLERLIKGSVNYGVAQIKNDREKASMYVTFKARNKKGDYLPLLRQTAIYQTDEKGAMLQAYSILSDLTGLNGAERVEWRISGSHIDQEQFAKYVHEAYVDFFSKREMGILKLLMQNMSSVEIGEELHISRHTVDTHRRNMLKKANCSGTNELLAFAHQNRII